MSTSTPTAEPPPAPAADSPHAHAGLLGGLVLGAHRLADRFDLVPADFGAENPVDVHDARAVGAEWLRRLRSWADYNPEEVFALKVGGGMLAIALVGLWLLVAVMR